jgi:hypothetical protein
MAGVVRRAREQPSLSTREGRFAIASKALKNELGKIEARSPPSLPETAYVLRHPSVMLYQSSHDLGGPPVQSERSLRLYPARVLGRCIECGGSGSLYAELLLLSRPYVCVCEQCWKRSLQ